jgi:hypothetical protein
MTRPGKVRGDTVRQARVRCVKVWFGVPRLGQVGMGPVCTVGVGRQDEARRARPRFGAVWRGMVRPGLHRGEAGCNWVWSAQVRPG